MYFITYSPWKIEKEPIQSPDVDFLSDRGYPRFHLERFFEIILT